MIFGEESEARTYPGWTQRNTITYMGDSNCECLKKSPFAVCDDGCREAVSFHEDCLIHTITHTFLLLFRPVNVQRLKQPPHPQDSLSAILVPGLLILCLSYFDNNQISLFPPVANLALSTWTCQHIPCKVEPIVLGCYGSEKFKPAVLTRLFRTKDPALINLSFSDSKQHFITIFQVIDYVSIPLKILTVWETAYCKDSTKRERWNPVTDLMFRKCFLAEPNFLLVLLWYGHILLWPRSLHVSCLYHISPSSSRDH